MPSATGPGSPDPVELRAEWPVHRQLVQDLALAGAVVGMVAGALAFGTPGLVLLPLGAAAGGGAGWWLGPRRLVLRLDEAGVAIGRLWRTERVPWAEVGGFGVVEGWWGRRGRMVALAVCRRGVALPRTVPARSYHASGWRMGRDVRPADEVAAHRHGLLDAVAPWAEAKGVPVVAGDVDSWWDEHAGPQHLRPGTDGKR